MGTIRSSHIFFLIRNYLIRLLPPREVQKQKKEDLSIFLFSTPSGARTLDPNIKSVVLYQLS